MPVVVVVVVCGEGGGGGGCGDVCVCKGGCGCGCFVERFYIQKKMNAVLGHYYALLGYTGPRTTWANDVFKRKGLVVASIATSLCIRKWWFFMCVYML